MKNSWVAGVGVVALCVGLVLLRATPHELESQVVLAKPSPSQGRSQTPNHYSQPVSQVPVEGHNQVLPNMEPKRPAGRFSASDFTDLFTAPDPYPVLLALSRSGRPGAFVAIHEFRDICFRAEGKRRELQNGLPFDSNDPDFALRQAAWEQMQRRCGPFVEQRDSNHLEPLPSDALGRALVRFTRGDPIGADGRLRPSIEELERDVQAMLDQGYISAVSGLHGQILAYVKRRAWDLSEVDRSVAFQLATLRSQSTNAKASQDLRLQQHCALFGVCGDSFDAALLGGTSGERRERIQAAAALMEKAIRAGDLNALLGPPIAKSGAASPPN